MLFKTRHYKDLMAKKPYTKIEDNRFVPSAALLAACIHIVTDNLFQHQYMIDLRDALDDSPSNIVPSEFVTTNPVMKDLLWSNVKLGERSVDKRELHLRNDVNIRNWEMMIDFQLVGNSALPPPQFPSAQFHIPSNATEMYGDQKLTHFHSGAIPEESEIVTRQRNEFRELARQDPKMVHYCALKRALVGTLPGIRGLMRKGKNSHRAGLRGLIPEETDAMFSTPALTVVVSTHPTYA